MIPCPEAEWISWTLSACRVASPPSVAGTPSTGGSNGRAAGISRACGSTRTMVTEAMPTGLRALVPAKMTSSIRAPRRVRADCSPKTQLMASLRLDFPHPLGPTMAAMPSPWKRSSVRSQNDLNPWSSTFFSLSTEHLDLATDARNHGTGESGPIRGSGTILTGILAKVK